MRIPMKTIRFHYRGPVERASGFPLRYRWIDGFSEGEGLLVSYPWMTRRECQALAKAEGAKAIFIRES